MSKEKVTIGVQIPGELYEKLSRIADEKFVSMSTLLRLVLFDYTNKFEAKLNDIGLIERGYIDNDRK